MIRNNIFFLITILFLTQCGYQTIYSNKNLNFNINEVKILNDQKVGRQIQNRLSVFNIAEEATYNFKLILDSKIEKKIASKDKKGNPKMFNLVVNVKIDVIGGDIKESKIFSESINYDNSENKFNLKRYEESLKENLTEKIIENFLIYLQSISTNKFNASLTGNIGYTQKKQ